MDLHPSILARIYAVGRAAADRDRSSAALAGVRVLFTPQYYDGKQSPATFTIAATDGKILVEEVHTVVSLDTEPWDIILRDWHVCKAWGKAPKKNCMDVTWTLERVDVTDARTNITTPTGRIARVILSDPAGRSEAVSTTDRTFPNYAKALETGTKATTAAVQGIDLRYLARLAECWDCPVRVTMGRGWFMSPVKRPAFGGDCRALVMPITLPD